MPFEKFVPQRKARPPQASVKPTGTISIDLDFSKDVGLDKVEYVTLYFDPARKLLGMKKAPNGREEGAFRLSHRKRVSSVRARPLFEEYGITLRQTQRVPVRFDEDEKMVVVPLAAAQRRRGRKPKRR